MADHHQPAVAGWSDKYGRRYPRASGARTPGERRREHAVTVRLEIAALPVSCPAMLTRACVGERSGLRQLAHLAKSLACTAASSPKLCEGQRMTMLIVPQARRVRRVPRRGLQHLDLRDVGEIMITSR
jgi:hypothetical protein